MGERRVAYRVLVGKLERDHLEDLDVDGRIILKRISRKWDGGIDLIGWLALVNAVMKLRVP
jgi:hypothetical protein